MLRREHPGPGDCAGASSGSVIASPQRPAAGDHRAFAVRWQHHPNDRCTAINRRRSRIHNPFAMQTICHEHPESHCGIKLENMVRRRYDRSADKIIV
jgi:hypothetical protein